MILLAKISDKKTSYNRMFSFIKKYYKLPVKKKAYTNCKNINYVYVHLFNWLKGYVLKISLRMWDKLD